VISTEYGVEHIYGEFISASWATASQYPTQICDRDTVADGAGGSFVDAINAYNIQYKANGIFINDTPEDVNASVEVPSGSNNFYVAGYYNNSNAYHNGTGGYSLVGIGGIDYYVNGNTYNLTGLNAPATVQVPSSGGTYYNDGTYIGYTWDGAGGYNYPVSGGSLYSDGTFIVFIPDSTFSQSTEVPSGSGNYYNAKFNGDDYFWNGSGGYRLVPASYFYTYGTFIYNDGSFDYYWDGIGGYYSITPP
jgi:hypothetical protein